jgi:hypothetical protein
MSSCAQLMPMICLAHSHGSAATAVANHRRLPACALIKFHP